MGIVDTAQWLKENFAHPLVLCEQLEAYFPKADSEEIYRYLMEFGMYRPNRDAWRAYETLKEDNIWKRAEEMFKRYRKKWKGPDVPIFIFPVEQGGGLFRRPQKTKSGVSFPDKLFLFLSPLDDPKEMEALFVHEYHHVCRMQKLNKRAEHYTLFDSIIIEGLAEYAVLKNCGEKYLAHWCHLYSEKQLGIFWEKHIKPNLNSTKDEKIHDDLLYGQGRIPSLLGYASGFSLVKEYYKHHTYNIQITFSIPAKEFVP